MQLIKPSLSIAFMGGIGYAMGHIAGLKPRQVALIVMAAECAKQIFCSIESDLFSNNELSRPDPHFFSTSPKAKSKNKAAILIHGCHVNAEEWDNIVYGCPGQLGRVPVGIEEAISNQAVLIFWGSGASQNSNGKKESEYTFSQAMGPKLKSLALHVKKSSQELSKYLKQVSHLDLLSRNTTEELEQAIILCLSKKITKLILITSPSHIGRCQREACNILFNQPDIPLKIYARASQTCFANSSPADVAIFEPPHRGDRPKIPFNQTAKRIVPLLIRNPQIAFEFNEACKRKVAAYEKKLKKKCANKHP